MSVISQTQRPVQDATPNEVASETRPIRKEPRSFLIVCVGSVSILVAIEWIIFIDAPLILCLLPLGFDTFFLSVICCWNHFDRLRRVLVLCVSVLAFPMWSVCGSLNVLIVLIAREETWDPSFNSLYGFFTALQILLGVAWLLVLIAAARSVDKRKKNKWMAEGVRRQLAGGGQLQDLPAYRA